MPYGITRFRCTVVKPYYHNSDQLIPENKDIDNDNRSVAEDTQGCDFDLTPSDSQQGLLVKRGRGRPKGTRNQPKLDKVRQIWEINGKEKDHPYEKTRLVIQAYDDQAGKVEIFTFTRCRCKSPACSACLGWPGRFAQSFPSGSPIHHRGS
ncbi:hypothetical protein EV44_g3533 [Erysiphe necator]|uniref:Uncharacterized protein n=1 Tax=Uncinula necator TaxID=52586 RepID=A0A0B1P5Y1_UNCNE|nr:hypothetical protein EV44_g3533 [Erysiphe necator]